MAEAPQVDANLSALTQSLKKTVQTYAKGRTDKATTAPIPATTARAKAPTPEAAPEITPEAEQSSDRTLNKNIPERPEVIIRKRRTAKEINDETNTKSPSGGESDTTKARGVPDTTSGDTDNAGDSNASDDGSAGNTGDGESEPVGEQDFGTEETDKSGKRYNNEFLAVRKAHETRKKQALALEKQVNDLKKQLDETKGWKKYKDRYEYEVSPERRERYEGTRAKIKDSSLVKAEAFGHTNEEIQPIYEKENLREALDLLDDTVTNQHANQQLAKDITEFYANKVMEAKDLQTANPAERHRTLREEEDRILAQKQTEKIQALSSVKKSTVENLEISMENPKVAKELWNGIFDPDISKYVETDLRGILKGESAKKFHALFDSLTERGAELSHEDSNRIAILSADATAGMIANSVIPILLDKLSSLEKEIKRQTGNANPRVRESTRVEAEEAKPKTLEDRVLETTKKIMGG